MARRGNRHDLQLRRLQAQTKAIRSINRLLFAIAGLLLGCVTVATWVPQRRELARLNERLAEAEREEREVLEEKYYRETELRAMRESVEFLELKARDRLNLRREGETVYRIRRNQESHR